MAKKLSLENFYFVPLEQGSEQKSFEGLAPGNFTEMWGRRISFSDADIIEIGNRTKIALSAKKVKEGDAFAGLPIEGTGHYSGGAVGWIKSASLSGDGKRVILNPEWNDEGKRILETKERRYFSPTIAVLGDESGERIIIGGTLTNWPAIRDENDLPLMKPVALEDGRFTFAPEPEQNPLEKILDLVKGLSKADDIESALQTSALQAIEEHSSEGATNMDVKKMLEKMSAEDKAEFITALSLESEGGIAEAIDQQLEAALKNVDSKVADIVDTRVQAELQKRELESFATDLVGGGEIGQGLPVEGDDLTEFLLSLKGDQIEKAKDIFTKIQTQGLTEFEEKGSSKINDEKPGEKELSDDFKKIIKSNLSRGISLEQFFEAQDDMDLKDYDLSEFEEKDDKKK